MNSVENWAIEDADRALAAIRTALLEDPTRAEELGMREVELHDLEPCVMYVPSHPDRRFVPTDARLFTPLVPGEDD